MNKDDLTKAIKNLDKGQQEWDSVVLARTLVPILEALLNGLSSEGDAIGDLSNSMGDLSNSVGDLSNSIGDLSNSLGDLSELETEDKSDLVKAINSLASDLNYLDSKSGSGSTEERPTSEILVGYMYFDTTIGLPVWWTGEKWIDAMGSDA